ncbi:MAG: hypothetical protein KGY55_02630, partial [Candidatus Thermoplasmatota archaeon]|nr:hypothetical protein [Candidatus Thermoplasmatota archaeon]
MPLERRTNPEKTRRNRQFVKKKYGTRLAGRAPRHRQLRATLRIAADTERGVTQQYPFLRRL